MRFKFGRSSCVPISMLPVSVTVPGLRAVATYLAWRFIFRQTAWLRPSAAIVYTPLLLCFTTASALSQQQTAELGGGSNSLPDAPIPQSGAPSAADAQRFAAGSASVTGVVLDTSGATIPGAAVSLTTEDRSKRQTSISGANGEFSFARLPPGSYLVEVTAKGFGPFSSALFVLSGQQAYQVPDISLSVAATNTEVMVRPVEVIAAEQMKAEEKQRLLGVIPNFYTSYVYDAAPLTTKQKYSLASRDTFDPVSLIGTGIAAGIEQANNTYAGYGQGAAGYGKRFGAQFANGRSSDFLSHAVFPSLFHQDPRYYYQGSGSVKSRVYHAVSFAFVTRSDSGGNVPNYSYFLADMCSGALSNLYYPKASRGANLVFTNAAIGLAGRAGSTVLREFLSKRLTTNVPGNGKP
jgi:hypothetical protein